MDIGKGEQAMVEGVTINLNGMWNYNAEEFIAFENKPAPSNQRTYFIPINPAYPALVEHPSFIQRQSEFHPERSLRRVLPDDFVDQELDSPVPYRQATKQDIRDAEIICGYTLGMAYRAMRPNESEE